VLAQDTCPCPPPPPPPPVWTGSASAGLGLTAGNSDTRNLNLSFEATRDPKTKNVFKLAALYLWSEQDGEESANRLAFLVREEYALSPRAFAFGQLQDLRDPFKEIDYLLAPTGGVGYKLVDTDRTKFSVDAGVGGSWEKNPGREVVSSGAVTASERFAHKLSETAAVTQATSALWTMDDFGDALYTFTAGIAASVTTRTSMKLELLDTYKTRPPAADVEKNDVALLASLVYKF
jgi:putative salt-induced outer membrane protein